MPLSEQGVGFRSLQETIDTTSSGGRLVCGLGRYVAGFCRRFVSSLMIGRIVPWVDPQLTQPRSHA